MYITYGDYIFVLENSVIYLENLRCELRYLCSKPLVFPNLCYDSVYFYIGLNESVKFSTMMGFQLISLDFSLS